MRMLWMANYIVRQSRGDRGLMLPQGPQTAPQAVLVQPHVPPLRPTAPTILSPLSRPRLTPPQPLTMPPRPTPPTPLPPATLLTVPPRPTRPTTLPPTPLLTVLQRPTELQPTPSPQSMHLPVLHVPDQSMHPLTHQSTPNDPDSPEPRSPNVFYNIPPMPLPPSQLPPPAAPAQPPPGVINDQQLHHLPSGPPWWPPICDPPQPSKAARWQPVYRCAVPLNVRAGGGAGAGAGAGARASPGTSNASPVDHGDQSQTPPVLACLN